MLIILQRARIHCKPTSNRRRRRGRRWFPHGQSVAEKRRRRRRCGDDGLSHKRRGSTTDVCRRHPVYPPPPFVRVKIRYTRARGRVFRIVLYNIIHVLYRCPRSIDKTIIKTKLYHKLVTDTVIHHKYLCIYTD